MPPNSVWKTFAGNLGIIGFIFGSYSGFIVRDEYNFPTVRKMDDLLHAYEENSERITTSREQAYLLLAQREFDRKAKNAEILKEKEVENSEKNTSENINKE